MGVDMNSKYLNAFVSDRLNEIEWSLDYTRCLSEEQWLNIISQIEDIFDEEKIEMISEVTEHSEGKIVLFFKGNNCSEEYTLWFPIEETYEEKEIPETSFTRYVRDFFGLQRNNTEKMVTQKAIYSAIQKSLRQTTQQ